jgi:hypothetical protein
MLMLTLLTVGRYPRQPDLVSPLQLYYNILFFFLYIKHTYFLIRFDSHNPLIIVTRNPAMSCELRQLLISLFRV